VGVRDYLCLNNLTSIRSPIIAQRVAVCQEVSKIVSLLGSRNSLRNVDLYEALKSRTIYSNKSADARPKAIH
jgi:hypothetical protein